MIMKLVFASAFALVAGYSVYASQQKIEMSDLAMANVEALADNEIGNGKWVVTVYSPNHWKCDPNGGASCPGIPWNFQIE